MGTLKDLEDRPRCDLSSCRSVATVWVRFHQQTKIYGYCKYHGFRHLASQVES